MVTDSLGRQFRKLRVSLTNECNFACTYCVGNDHVAPNRPAPAITDVTLAKARPLPLHELVKLVERLHRELHLSSIRLTGGEPLLTEGIAEFIQSLKGLGIDDIRLTTNGYMLAMMAGRLKKAGLSSVNVSLDAMDPDIFFTMSRRNGLQRVLEGIEASLAAGFKTRINTVVMRGRNENQIIPLLEYAMQRGIEIRFLELMGMGPLHKHLNNWFFGEKDILNTIETRYACTPLPHENGSTANYWNIERHGTFGIIANESTPFCSDCNRLRLDSFGNIYGCLTNLKGIGISKEVASNESLTAALTEAMAQKQTEKFKGSPVTMMEIGG